MQPETVIFDIGRVLIHWDPEGFYDSVIGRPARERLFAEVDLHGMNIGIDAGNPWRESVEALAGRHPDWGAAIRLWHDRWIEMASPAIDRSVRLLRALRARGVPVLALTNFGNETLKIAKARFDFLNEFDRMFVSAELRLLKPDPAIYAALEMGTGYAPQRLFFTDDRPENCDAAAARGWHTHVFDGPEGLEKALLAHGLLTEETLP